jgi:hypothetical protein
MHQIDGQCEEVTAALHAAGFNAAAILGDMDQGGLGIIVICVIAMVQYMDCWLSKLLQAGVCTDSADVSAVVCICITMRRSRN